MKYRTIESMDLFEVSINLGDPALVPPVYPACRCTTVPGPAQGDTLSAHMRHAAWLASNAEYSDWDPHMAARRAGHPHALGRLRLAHLRVARLDYNPQHYMEKIVTEFGGVYTVSGEYIQAHGRDFVHFLGAVTHTDSLIERWKAARKSYGLHPSEYMTDAQWQAWENGTWPAVPDPRVGVPKPVGP